MNNKQNILSIVIIFLCIFLKYFLEFSDSNIIIYSILFFIILLSLIRIFNLKLQKKELMNIFLFGAISCIFIIIYKDANFMISFLLALVLLDTKKKNFIKTFLISSIILYATVILLNSFGILENNEMIRNVENEILIRNTLGFSHPNSVFLFFLPIALCGYYLYSDKKKYFIIVTISAIILYLCSYSRTGLVSILLLIILHFAAKLLKNKKNYAKWIPIIFLFSTISSILITIYFGNSTNIFSEFLSDRPFYWNYYFENGTMFSLIGKNFVAGYYLDNYYLYLLVEFGIIGYFIYLSVYLLSVKKGKIGKKEFVVVCVFLLYGLCESNVIIGAINFMFAIQLNNIISSKERLEKKEKINETIS